MELRQLEYFVAVAEEQSFTRAASRLHVVQSAVSAAIKALERELGAVLLDRNARRVLLTDAGTALLPRARVALDAARDAREAVAEVHGGLRGTLRIGTLTSIRIIDLPALLGEFHRRYPGVLLRTSAAPSGSAGLIEAIVEHRLDLAFVSLPGGRPAGVRLIDLVSAPMDLVVPAGHPLAGRAEVPIGDLAGMDFIDSPVGYGNRAVTDRAFAGAGVPRHVTIEIADIATGVAHVRHGLGVALLPRFILTAEQTGGAVGARASTDGAGGVGASTDGAGGVRASTDGAGGVGAGGVVTVPVTGADLRWPLSLAVPADRTPGAAARALIALISDFLPVGAEP